ADHQVLPALVAADRGHGLDDAEAHGEAEIKAPVRDEPPQHGNDKGDQNPGTDRLQQHITLRADRRQAPDTGAVRATKPDRRADGVLRANRLAAPVAAQAGHDVWMVAAGNLAAGSLHERYGCTFAGSRDTDRSARTKGILPHRRGLPAPSSRTTCARHRPRVDTRAAGATPPPVPDTWSGTTGGAVSSSLHPALPEPRTWARPFAVASAMVPARVDRAIPVQAVAPVVAPTARYRRYSPGPRRCQSRPGHQRHPAGEGFDGSSGFAPARHTRPAASSRRFRGCDRLSPHRPRPGAILPPTCRPPTPRDAPRSVDDRPRRQPRSRHRAGRRPARSLPRAPQGTSSARHRSPDRPPSPAPAPAARAIRRRHRR